MLRLEGPTAPEFCVYVARLPLKSVGVKIVGGLPSAFCSGLVWPGSRNTPKPPRIAVAPFPKTSYANPNRGPKASHGRVTIDAGYPLTPATAVPLAGLPVPG